MEGLNISVPAVEKLCSDTVSDVMMNDELYIIFQIYQLLYVNGNPEDH